MTYIYLSLVLIFIYFFYKIRFHNFNRFKIYLFRLWLVGKSKTRKKIKKDSNLDPLTERGINIWKSCVKDKRSVLNFSYISKSRQVILGNLYLHFIEDGYERGIIKIYNNDSCSSYFECYIIKSQFEDVADYFDLEVEKRMRVVDTQNKSMVLKSLDNLLEGLKK